MDRKNIDAQKLGLKTDEFVKALEEVTDIIWKSEKYQKVTDRFYYTTFMKVRMLLDGIFLQVYNLDNKPHYSIGVALQMRTAMLDLLGLYYVVDEIDDEAAQLTRVYTIMADHVKYTWNDFTKDQKNQVRQDWPDLFDVDGHLKKFPNVGTKIFMAGIVKQVHTLKEAEVIKPIYDFFSKLEHNGAFTFDLIHDAYSPQGNEKLKGLIKKAIVNCAIALKFLSNHWLLNNAPIMLKIERIIADIDTA
ncbi:hypothetical protein [Chryseobacterium sp. ERMR1:04]|uniref:hypothetical protein n=1 Tax=Chryseobacterium sp. ERMR1:04 TaxID=1705393 RepID=UPI0006C8C7BE|nr:hypothetical protein [Chryseobacterium sp. ERMR1:04]KPH13390.1 hypothetical protein AMQ68_13185 [Chryseobacterium sp. ERMR1:04]